MIVALLLFALTGPPCDCPAPPCAEELIVEQVEVPRAGSQSRIEQVDRPGDAHVEVEQLPDTIELPREAAAPETGLAQLAPEPPRVELYREVASAWEMIRRRGQQPTPELIAREIGPDVLGRFLNQFPGSEAMFGVDTDRLPISPPALPEGAPPDDGSP